MSYVLNTRIEFFEKEFTYLQNIRILRYLANKDISLDDFVNLYYYKEIKIELENINIYFNDDDILLLKNNIISYNLFEELNDIIDCGFLNTNKTRFYSFGFKDNRLKLIMNNISLFDINNSDLENNSDSENNWINYE
jgi:hypothetical protein